MSFFLLRSYQAGIQKLWFHDLWIYYHDRVLLLKWANIKFWFLIISNQHPETVFPSPVNGVFFINASDYTLRQAHHLLFPGAPAGGETGLNRRPWTSPLSHSKLVGSQSTGLTRLHHPRFFGDFPFWMTSRAGQPPKLGLIGDYIFIFLWIIRRWYK